MSLTAIVGVGDAKLCQLLLHCGRDVVDNLVVTSAQVLEQGVLLGHQFAAEVTPGVLATIIITIVLFVHLTVVIKNLQSLEI